MVFIDCYKTYVRPNIKYCSPAWSMESMDNAGRYREVFEEVSDKLLFSLDVRRKRGLVI